MATQVKPLSSHFKIKLQHSTRSYYIMLALTNHSLLFLSAVSHTHLHTHPRPPTHTHTHTHTLTGVLSAPNGLKVKRLSSLIETRETNEIERKRTTPTRRLQPVIRNAIEVYPFNQLHHVNTAVKQSLPSADGECLG